MQVYPLSISKHLQDTDEETSKKRYNCRHANQDQPRNRGETYTYLSRIKLELDDETSPFYFYIQICLYSSKGCFVEIAVSADAHLLLSCLFLGVKLYSTDIFVVMNTVIYLDKTTLHESKMWR